MQTALQTVFISDPNSPAAGKLSLWLWRVCWVLTFLVVNSVKQASAFPPNFIHSLDATHMMMTALECQVGVVLSACVIYS